ncbi:ABC transporter permease protein [Borrelia coriaceae ATCC 43381]|uniref:ABC transporter permease protein n=1 Tax=Borrelia coriaceae ATCC 43381 TaxID=1408429 RepID=W5SU76_9SPIR|nr:ABC transporter permease protein [Borrelia coriaceae ATCC 43381]
MFDLKRFFLLFNFAYNKKLYLYFVISIFLIFPLIHVFLKVYWFADLIYFCFNSNNRLFFFRFIVYCVNI